MNFEFFLLSMETGDSSKCDPETLCFQVYPRSLWLVGKSRNLCNQCQSKINWKGINQSSKSLIFFRLASVICAMELSSATYRVTSLYLTLRRRVMWSAHCARNPLVKTIHSSVISESFILKLRLTRRRRRPRLKPRRRKARRKGSSQNFVIVVERHLSPLGPLWAIRKRFTSWS